MTRLAGRDPERALPQRSLYTTLTPCDGTDTLQYEGYPLICDLFPAFRVIVHTYSCTFQELAVVSCSSAARMSQHEKTSFAKPLLQASLLMVMKTPRLNKQSELRPSSLVLTRGAQDPIRDLASTIRRGRFRSDQIRSQFTSRYSSSVNGNYKEWEKIRRLIQQFWN